jgi:hypothetical protein
MLKTLIKQIVVNYFIYCPYVCKSVVRVLVPGNKHMQVSCDFFNILLLIMVRTYFNIMYNR